jgi:5'-nucleotidase
MAKSKIENSVLDKVKDRKPETPLIILVNDDGIRSPGIRAMARTLMQLGEVMIIAPRDQQTSTGRSLRGGGIPKSIHYEIDGKLVRAFAVAATPAMAVRYGVLICADRAPALIVAGINYGENVGNGVTISGTIGAALEAACMGFPALAVSQSVEPHLHFTHSETVDFTVAAEFGKRFAKKILQRGMPRGADIVNVNIPDGATLRTLWRWTRTSRMNYYRSTIRESRRGKSIIGYTSMVAETSPEPDSDVRAVLIDHVVSVSLLTFDLTARVSQKEKERWGK